MIKLIVTVDGEEYANLTSTSREKCIKYAGGYIEQALTDCVDKVTVSFSEESGLSLIEVVIP